ncbi:MAG: Crp/Fnr family transcriptional regulator [Thermoflexibacter sp.]
MISTTVIAPHILQQYEASLNRFVKGEYIFHENWQAHFYFQVEEGIVKMCNEGEKNDFIQGIFLQGESFGEPPLFADFPYPASACAVCDTKIWVLRKDNFFALIKENPDAHLNLTKTLALRLRYKSFVLRDINTNTPEDRILTIIDYFKQKIPFEKRGDGFYEVPFTRQLLADMAGLRVETVIKKITELAESGFLEIRQHKIFRKY